MTRAKAATPRLEYSEAFEKLVQGPDDVVGLLAYANYKMSIREMYQSGQSVDLASRSLTPTSIDTYRSAAEQKITEIVEDGIQAAAPDIRNTALTALIERNHSEADQIAQATRDEIKEFVKDRTGWISSFLTNMAAWIVTIVIASLILFIARNASVEQTIAEKLDRPGNNVSQVNSTNTNAKREGQAADGNPRN